MTENLMPDEEVVQRGTLHGFVFAAPIGLIVLGLLTLSGQFETANSFLGVIALLVGIGFLVAVFRYWTSTQLTVTNKQVIAKTLPNFLPGPGQQNLIRLKTVALEHSKVESLKVDQSFFGRMFDFGTVTICDTRGGATPVLYISRPLHFRQEAMRVIENRGGFEQIPREDPRKPYTESGYPVSGAPPAATSVMDPVTPASKMMRVLENGGGFEQIPREDPRKPWNGEDRFKGLFFNLAFAVVAFASVAAMAFLVSSPVRKEREASLAQLSEWRSQAEKGDADAQYNVGLHYGVGSLVREDPVEAVRWYRLAADQGHARAQWSLGYSYRNGEGVRMDAAEAERWFRRAAEQGDCMSQYALGSLYYDDKGVRRDYAEALKWYRQAAERGDQLAQTRIAGMNALGQGMPVDLVAAYAWLDVADTAGYSGGTHRDIIANRMSNQQIVEAQMLAREWENQYGCGPCRQSYLPSNCTSPVE